MSWPAESEGIVDEPCECLHDEGSVDDVNGIKEVWIACGWVCKMKVDGERGYSISNGRWEVGIIIIRGA